MEATYVNGDIHGLEQMFFANGNKLRIESLVCIVGPYKGSKSNSGQLSLTELE